MSDVVVFWDTSFPFIDTCPLEKRHLEAGLNGCQVTFASADTLAQALGSNPDVFVNPYGSAFPKSLWPGIKAYLIKGGNWVNLGGRPFYRPVRRQGEEWMAECPQVCYSKELRINQFAPVETTDLAWNWCVPGDFPEADLLGDQITEAWSLQVRFAEGKEYPDETGSTDMRLAGINRILEGRRDDRLLAAPIVEIHRWNGAFAPGRWVLANANFTLPVPAEVIQALVQRASLGSIELRLRPGFACYYQGEKPTLTAYANAPKIKEKLTIKIHPIPPLHSVERGPGGEVLWEPGGQAGRVEVSATVPGIDIPPLHSVERGQGGEVSTGGQGGEVLWEPGPEVFLPKAASPGLHCFTATLETEDGAILATTQTGYWFYDESLMESGSPLSANNDYFLRDGKPYPVTGTTYMAGDVHRKFLFEPNPAVWDQDFRAMKQAGINMVRTGIWTGWSRIMQDPGSMDEGVLRAFTAWMLTARKYDIPVIFNFFAFLPPAWGGANPYFDPRCVQAQKSFIAAFVLRLKNCNTLLWDLINEPSFSSPAQEWSTRPNYDQHEQEAWQAWLLAQADEDEWRERWRITTDEPLSLPTLKDFEDQQINQGTHPLKALTYRLFAQESFRDWAAEMVGVIRANGNPNQLVTVGQDEGGTGERPAPHFYGPAVDFTSNHSWWANDDLLWDSVFTKLPDKPNLIEETGIMFVEAPDGQSLRSPQITRNLLERKLALAFAAGCAGFIQWLWNTNIYMDSDNEVGIGFLRADGTEKPELEAFREVAAFMAKHAGRMSERIPEEVVILIPHSNHFSTRNYSERATRAAVRMLEYSLGTAARCVSEYRPLHIGTARLLVVPSLRNFSGSAWDALMTAVENGAVALITGFIESDEYFRPVARLDALGIRSHPLPVSHTELLVIHTETVEAHFRGEGITFLERAAGQGVRDGLMEFKVGKGTLLYAPVPLELSEGDALRTAYYRALAVAGIPVDVHPPGLLDRKVVFNEGTLHLLVNESGWDTDEAPAGRARLAFHEQLKCRMY